MQDIMFATFLYAAITCFVCCLRYQPSCAVEIATNSTNQSADEPQLADVSQVSTTEPEQKPEAANALIEQEAGVQGAGFDVSAQPNGCKDVRRALRLRLERSAESRVGERVSLVQKSPAAMPWSEAEQGLQSPTSLSCLHSVGVQFPSVCPPAPPSPAPLPLFEESLVASDGSYKPAQSEELVVETLKAVESEPVKAVGTLDPSTLTLRQCRAVIREINKGLPKVDRIRQKINGKDAPADWLRSQIAHHLEAQPASVIANDVVQKACIFPLAEENSVEAG